jgi:hypothetical protein
VTDVKLWRRLVRWKKITYKCDRSSNLDRVVELRCATLLELELTSLQILPYLVF